MMRAQMLCVLSKRYGGGLSTHRQEVRGELTMTLQRLCVFCLRDKVVV